MADLSGWANSSQGGADRGGAHAAEFAQLLNRDRFLELSQMLDALRLASAILTWLGEGAFAATERAKAEPD